MTHSNLGFPTKRYVLLVQKLETPELRKLFSFMVRKGTIDQRTTIVEKELIKRS